MVSVIFAIALAAVTSGGLTGHNHPALSCAYSSQFGGDTLTHSRCAWKDRNGEVHIRSEHLVRLDYDSYGLASIAIDQAWYYVLRDGRVAPTEMFDNWADPFVDGLARSPRNGKVGYIDRHLNLIIPANYDGAYVFDHGFAVVCQGCTLMRDGAGSWYAGGRWGCIDSLGREQSPLRALKPGEFTDAVCKTYR
jgi:hypothetical protein